MKQNIIMIIILVALFFFGLLIYDFSDELDKSVTAHDWYALENDEMTVISFKDYKFSYYYSATGEKVSLYDLCITYRYNRSINVIKLKCNIKGNKLYVSKVTDDELNLTIDGEEKKFYATEDKAKEAAFIKNNNLSNEEFSELMTIDLNKFTITTANDIVNLYKSKDVKLIAFASENKTIQNALNLKALYNLAAHSNKSLLVINYNKIESSELNKLLKLNNRIPKSTAEFNENMISLYVVGNKKFELITDIEVSAFSEVNNYNNI